MNLYPILLLLECEDHQELLIIEAPLATAEVSAGTVAKADQSICIVRRKRKIQETSFTKPLLFQNHKYLLNIIFPRQTCFK